MVAHSETGQTDLIPGSDRPGTVATTSLAALAYVLLHVRIRARVEQPAP
mgnify:CR=1 FL=1